MLRLVIPLPFPVSRPDALRCLRRHLRFPLELDVEAVFVSNLVISWRREMLRTPLNVCRKKGHRQAKNGEAVLGFTQLGVDHSSDCENFSCDAPAEKSRHSPISLTRIQP